MRNKNKTMMKRTTIGTALLGLVLAGSALPALAQPQSGPQTGVVFRNTVTGEALDVTQGKEGGRDTPAVKKFFETGENL